MINDTYGSSILRSIAGASVNDRLQRIVTVEWQVIRKRHTMILPGSIRSLRTALRQRVAGIVKLTAVFAGSDEIKNIQVINGLPYGLTENAIARP